MMQRTRWNNDEWNIAFFHGKYEEKEMKHWARGGSTISVIVHTISFLRTFLLFVRVWEMMTHVHRINRISPFPLWRIEIGHAGVELIFEMINGNVINEVTTAAGAMKLPLSHTLFIYSSAIGIILTPNWTICCGW